MGEASESRPFSRRQWVLLIVTIWAAFGLFFSLMSLSVRTAAGQSFDLIQVLANDLLYVALWGATTPLALGLSRRFRVARPHVVRNVFVLIACAIVVSAAQRFAYEWAVFALPPSGGLAFEWARVARTVLATSDYGVAIFGIVVLFEHATSLQQRIHAEAVRTTRLEAALTTARMDALERQLQPHFLFNTLNAISTLVTVDPGRAQVLIGRLGELLRATLAQPGAHEISVRHEVGWLEQYLAIESARVGPRLRIALELDPDALAARVPRLLLQPLVENAIKHGVASRPGRACLTVGARRSGERLELRVRDEPEPGAPATPALDGDPASAPGLGIGLANTRSRLDTLYGAAHRFERLALPGGGSEVIVHIPYRTVPSGTGEAPPAPLAHGEGAS